MATGGNNMDRLKNKVAVITGGCSGIGLGTVEHFVAEGAQVMVGDIDDAAGAALAARFEGRVAYTHCNVMEESQIEALMAAAVARFGGLDIVFNNAGAGGTPARIDEMTGDGWDRTQSLLLRSVALGIRYAVPHLKARGGGAIVNTASIAGVQSGAAPIAYSVAKAGVIHLTRIAGAELARSGIRVNAVCPGLILTNIFTANTERVPAEAAPQVKQMLAKVAPHSQPIAKAGLPEDIAKAVLFFASDDSAFVTGEHLLVDGGAFIGPRHAWDQAAAAEREALMRGQPAKR
jgi:NAD(P)-dependent dehydrogenase (short-subunit alcohol dehydrogenase family)